MFQLTPHFVFTKMILFNPSFGILVIILSVLAVSTKDSDSNDAQTGRHFNSNANTFSYSSQNLENSKSQDASQNINEFDFKNASLVDKRTGTDNCFVDIRIILMFCIESFFVVIK